MAEGNPNNEHEPSGDPRRGEDGTLEPLPRLWQYVNESADPTRPFESNVPLPIPEPPAEVPGIDTKPFPHRAASPLPPLGSSPVSPVAGGAPPLGPLGSDPDDTDRDSGPVEDDDSFRPTGKHVMAALVVAVVLIASAVMLLGGGGDGETKSSADPKPTVAPTTSVAPGIEVATSAVSPGDCLILPDYSPEDPFANVVTVVPCTKEHNAEVIDLVTTPMDLHSEIAPIDLESAGQFLCGQQFGEYTGQDAFNGNLALAPLVGTRRSLMVCLVRDPQGGTFVGALGTPATTTVQPIGG